MKEAWPLVEENLTGGARPWRFGSFHLDVQERRLTREGIEVALAPKAFDLLVFLVERNGRLVRKGELMEALWPDAVVTDVSLARQVSSLRKALGDTRRDQRLIRTVAKSGYRFVGAAEQAPAAPAPANPVPGRTLAVLPFQSLSGEDEPHLALGLADTLIARLALVPELTVRPIHAVRRYTDPDQDPLAAGRALRVNSVLDGTWQRMGSRLRLRARLLDVPTQRVVWTRVFEETAGDLFAVQDAIAGQVGQALIPALSPARHTSRPQTRDAAAYELFLRGRYAWTRRAPQSLEAAVRYFDEALALDPGYADAHAARADALSLLAGYGRPLGAFAVARDAASRALALDPTCADAHAVLGLIAQKSLLDWQGAEGEYRRALDLQPRHLTALQRSGELLALRGRFEEGLRRLEQARQIDPVSASVGTDLAKACLYARRYAKAAREARAVLDIEPAFCRARLYLGLALLLGGEPAQGLGEIQAFALEEDSAYATGVWAWAEAAAGRPEHAERLQRRLTERAGFVPPYALVLAHLAVGDQPAALDVLERMLREGHNVLGLGVSPLLDALRGHARYEGFVAEGRLLAPTGD